MTEPTSPYMMGPKTLAEKLGNSGWWSRLRGSSMNAAASLRLRELSDTCDDLHKRLAGQERAFVKERNAYEKNAKSLYQRTLMAITELEAYKKNGRSEVAVAVILSPSQYGELTCHGAFRQSKIAKLGIYVARGVYGPVVLTQDGFNGFTRMAPELDIRAKNPTNGHDW